MNSGPRRGRIPYELDRQADRREHLDESNKEQWTVRGIGEVNGHRGHRGNTESQQIDTKLNAFPGLSVHVTTVRGFPAENIL